MSKPWRIVALSVGAWVMFVWRLRQPRYTILQANYSRLDLSGDNCGLFGNNNRSLETNRERASRWRDDVAGDCATYLVFRVYLLIVPLSLRPWWRG